MQKGKRKEERGAACRRKRDIPLEPRLRKPAEPAGKKEEEPVSAREDLVAGKAMALVFCAFLFLLALAFLLGPSREFSPQENRYLAQAPEFSWQKVRDGGFMSDFEEYVTDQFPARDLWVSFKALCQRLLGQKENNGVYNGAGDYLIGALQPVDPALAEKNLAAVEAMRRLGESLRAGQSGTGQAPEENFDGTSLSQGVPVQRTDAPSEKGEEGLEGLKPFSTALLLVPTAAEVLQDKLPSHAYLPYQRELLEKAAGYLGSAYIDVAPALRQRNAAGEQVYYRTDHHWVTAAAYEGYAAYLSWLGLEPFRDTDYLPETVSREFYGTLWSKNSLPGFPPDTIERWVLSSGEPAIEVTYYDGETQETSASLYAPAYLEGKDKYSYFLNGNKPLTVIRRQRDSWEEGQSGLGRLLLFKDSYAHCLIPFLVPHFQEIHVVDLRYWRKDPVEYLKENQIDQVLFLYNGETFATDRTISQIGSYLARYGISG